MEQGNAQWEKVSLPEGHPVLQMAIRTKLLGQKYLCNELIFNLHPISN